MFPWEKLKVSPNKFWAPRRPTQQTPVGNSEELVSRYWGPCEQENGLKDWEHCQGRRKRDSRQRRYSQGEYLLRVTAWLPGDPTQNRQQNKITTHEIILPLSVLCTYPWGFPFSKGGYLHTLHDIMGITKGWPALWSCFISFLLGNLNTIYIVIEPWEDSILAVFLVVLSCCKEHRQGTIRLPLGEWRHSLQGHHELRRKGCTSEAAQPSSPENWSTVYHHPGYNGSSRS